MTPTQYRNAIKSLGMKPPQAAEFMELSLRSSRYYAARGAPTVVEMLLRVMLAKGISVDEVNRIMRRPKESKHAEITPDSD